MNSAIDKIVGSLSDHQEHTGLVVGVINREGQAIYGYGRANDGGAPSTGEPPSGDTLFEIGSVTKLFTASLLAILEAEGRLSLDDAVRDHEPSLAHFPPEMTLLRLATHTAGLPKMPSNLLRSMLKDRSNPHAAYTTDDLFAYLSKHKPKGDLLASTQISYSNLGYALLGHILARACDSSYEQAVVSRICEELAMDDTRIGLTPEQRKRLAPPHTAGGKRNQNWELPAFAGAGALRSTASDLLKFLGANLGGRQSPLTEVATGCQQIRYEAFRRPGLPQRLVSGILQRGGGAQDRHQGMALGWFVGRLSSGGERVHWHHGATGGYRAFAGFVKSSGTGAIVLANRGPGRLDLLSSGTSVDEIGFEVLRHLNGLDR